MPAPLGNTNAIRHGLRRLNLNALPPGCGRLRSVRAKLRTVLEEFVLERHGDVGPYEAAVIQSAIRWETHAALCARWLRLSAEKMSHGDRLSYSREVARASSERDRCLKTLGLDRSDKDTIFDVLYGPQEPRLPPADGDGKEDHQGSGNATGDASGNEGGDGTAN